MSGTPRSAADWAKELGRRGFLIFPLRPGAKEPYLDESWVSMMTSDPEVIDFWFDERPDMNYGVCPGPRRVIVDLDRKPTADGLETLAGIQEEQDVTDWVIDQTFTVQSPSGGLHLYLSVSSPASNAHSFPPKSGIDIRGAHGYVVGPGCVLIKGQCKDKDTPGDYKVVTDIDVLAAPAWIETRLRKHSDVEKRDHTPLVDLDSEEAVSRAIEFLRHRDPAVEGLGGDHHTLVTAMCLIDFGLSEEKALELLVEPFLCDGETEPQSWNDRCLPPWDVHGRKNTLEEKVRNAWRYREREPGAKGGAFDEADLQDIVDIATMNAEEGAEKRFARIREHMFRGGAVFKRGKRREFVIPEWLPAHGMTACLAVRNTGKTVVMLDMALRIALEMDWHGYPVKEGFLVVYVCGEDDEGAEEQLRAWCAKHDLEEPPDRFIFLDIMTDLMSPDDTREWAEALKAEIGQHNRAVIFLDTWQRATSRAAQNKDDEMQKAVHHAEALARSLNGPAVVAFHPPKHDDKVVMGSSIIENATTAIWNLADHANGKRLEVTRIKGKGVGNYQMFRFDEIGLGEDDEFGKERTGVVPIKLGGVESEDGMTEGEYESRRAFAHVLREIETRRKDDDPDSSKHYAATKMAKIIAEDLPAKEEDGDEWAKELLDMLREAGTVNIKSWKRINERIIELFGRDPRGYDFGDGYALRLYSDKNSRRVKIDKSGVSA